MTIKKIMAAITATVLCFMLSAAALAESLVPGGGAVGIRMTTDGVVVAGISEVETSSGKRSPAADAGLKKGDVITRLGGSEIATAQDFKAALSALDGSKTTVTFERGGKQKQLNITPAQGTDGAWKLGLWLRDGKTEAAAFLGDIRINCGCGIFGTADFDGETMETGEFETGPATIRCTLEGSQTREYGIEIKKVYSSSEGTTVMLTVTDPELIALTGGIVQGMSGSPIIQNGRLVGAVTHVFVNDPTSGYGVSIEDMLRYAQHVS